MTPPTEQDVARIAAGRKRKYCDWFDFLIACCAILERNGLAVRAHLQKEPR